MFEVVNLLKNKITGNYHCPYCIEILRQRGDNLYCKKCKKEFSFPKNSKDEVNE